MNPKQYGDALVVPLSPIYNRRFLPEEGNGVPPVVLPGYPLEPIELQKRINPPKQKAPAGSLKQTSGGMVDPYGFLKGGSTQ